MLDIYNILIFKPFPDPTLFEGKIAFYSPRGCLLYTLYTMNGFNLKIQFPLFLIRLPHKPGSSSHCLMFQFQLYLF